MTASESESDFATALKRLRDGRDESYESWLHGQAEVIDVAREHDLEAALVVQYPGVQQAIWRYQHHDAETVRRAIETAIDRKGYGHSVEAVVEALVEAAAIIAGGES